MPETPIRPEQLSEVERVARALAALYDTYRPEGVGIWLRGAKRTFGGQSPLDVLAAGRVDEFCTAIGRLEGREL